MPEQIERYHAGQERQVFIDDLAERDRRLHPAERDAAREVGGALAVKDQRHTGQSFAGLRHDHRRFAGRVRAKLDFPRPAALPEMFETVKDEEISRENDEKQEGNGFGRGTGLH